MRIAGGRRIGGVFGWTNRAGVRIGVVGIAALLGSGAMPARMGAATMEWTLQTRDLETGEAVLSRERVDPRRVGVIAVDVWNYHWCKTATLRVDAIVPRLNRALEAARELGMTVMLCPSDVVDNYAGFAQREAVLALPGTPVPKVMEVTCPPVPDAGGCACGRERCAGNYGWDGMHPGLRIGEGDWMPDTQEEVYAICRKFGLTHLLYMGFHTQVCLLGKPMGLRAMKSAGLQCVLARDMTDAHPGYDPSRGFTPDGNTGEVVSHFERYLAPTVHFGEELRRMGRWRDDGTVLDPVRIAPWGTTMRPHLFEEPIVVSLATPLQPGAEIRFTLDGTVPLVTSPRYGGPLRVTETTRLRAAGFDGGRLVSAESEGVFVKLAPQPPMPDVRIGDLEPIRNVGFGHTYGGEVRYSGDTRPPQKDRSNRGDPIRIQRRVYERGLGVHAPCAVSYRIEPGYERFVGLAGVDEHLLDRSYGSNLARYPSVVFKVFLDGREVASSPVMRIQFPAWRFNVPLPQGAQVLTLVAMDAGDGNREDLANWADAGFVRKR
ncbi:MAG: NPCBM/NEW2 domain-containing protein [Verrucomicrobiae bacterium]|nr:NPCBM/NEW2 domain-containing protein [Verrucomicrobiae bacterium]